MPEFKTPFTDLISFLLDPSGNCCNEGDSGVPWRWSFIDPSFELSLSLLASNEEIEKINWSVIIVRVCTSITPVNGPSFSTVQLSNVDSFRTHNL